ncbi:MAG: PKD domain-containing protein [Deltaproteobacteria bacterium]|nr:PKD domain-containing protein [Deltaproteobacteria bacterium]
MTWKRIAALCGALLFAACTEDSPGGGDPSRSDGATNANDGSSNGGDSGLALDTGGVTPPDAGATSDASIGSPDAQVLNGVPFYGSAGSSTGPTGCGGTEICNNGLDDNCNEQIDELCGCAPGAVPCWSGFPAQAGVGVCTMGTQTCEIHSEDRVLGPCTNEGRPQTVQCGAGIDFHCNGIIDEGCNCREGETRSCYTGPVGTSGVGTCHDGTQTCVVSGSTADFGPCVGDQTPEATNPCDGTDPMCTGDPALGCACILGTTQACYTGPAATRGVGLCHDGSQTCVRNGGSIEWGPCTDEALPATQNSCDGRDHLCNAMPDLGCTCVLGSSRACYDGPLGTENVGLCRAGTQSCISVNGSPNWTPCTGQVLPSPNTCDGVNRACNANPNFGCDCTPNASRPCYDGPPGTAGVGLCVAGTETCVLGPGGVGAVWGTCTNQVLPALNTCDGVDRACDGNPSAGCACIFGEARECYSGPANTRQIGICRDGTQTCVNSGGTPVWSTVCAGETLPLPTEICGNGSVDDNCSGAHDEGCGPIITCPSDRTILAGVPTNLSASATSPGHTIATWVWTITNGPPAGLATPNLWSPGPPSAATETFRPYIPGQYTIRVTATDDAGTSASCDVRVTVQGHGLRATLTWDGIGDIDLHVHNGNNTPWFSQDDCYYHNCASVSGALPWDAMGTNDDPRLDFDNKTDNGPENTSIDFPMIGRTYTIAAHNFAYRFDLTPPQTDLRRATIQIFCGSNTSPAGTFTSDVLEGTSWGPDCNGNEFWKAASVVFTSLDTCVVTPLNQYDFASTFCGSF